MYPYRGRLGIGEWELRDLRVFCKISVELGRVDEHHFSDSNTDVSH